MMWIMMWLQKVILYQYLQLVLLGREQKDNSPSIQTESLLLLGRLRNDNHELDAVLGPTIVVQAPSATRVPLPSPLSKLLQPLPKTLAIPCGIIPLKRKAILFRR